MTTSEMLDADSLIAALPMPAMLVGRSERIKAANDLATGLFGSGLVGRHYISALRQPGLLDAVEGALRTRQPRAAPYLAADGTRDTTWAARAVPVGDTVLVTLEDRTELEEAGQMRRDFVANVSHELRSPLTSLLGFIETLRHSARDDAAARERFLGIMEREATRMSRLVRDLLSLSRVESEERMRPRDRVDVAGVLRQAASRLTPAAKAAGAELALEIDPETEGQSVAGDADQLGQVFSNLIENAIKYGGGAVTVRCAVDAACPILRCPAMRIEIADDGDGFDPVHIPRLTERFYRIDTHRSREIGGTGLGLAIVKHIVGRHRGRLRIASEPGRGSRFTVHLAIADQPPRAGA